MFDNRCIVYAWLVSCGGTILEPMEQGEDWQNAWGPESPNAVQSHEFHRTHPAQERAGRDDSPRQSMVSLETCEEATTTREADLEDPLEAIASSVIGVGHVQAHAGIAEITKQRDLGACLVAGGDRGEVTEIGPIHRQHMIEAVKLAGDKLL